MIQRCFFIFFLCCIAAAQSTSQSVYVHPSHEVYDFLKRMDGKRVLTDYRDAVKPITRREVAAYLIIIDQHSNQLTSVEKQQLEFFKQEFFVELKQLKYEKELPEERWHLYPYRSTPGTFNVDLVGGVSAQENPTKTNTKIWSNGLMGYGYEGNFIGMYLYFRDNHETGTYVNVRNDLTPLQGQVMSDPTNGGTDFDLYDAQMNFDVASFLVLSIEKMPNVWGPGYHGNIILSDRPPSYPQIKLRAKLGKDVDFTFIHSWLSSGIIDSVDSYYVPGLPPSQSYRPVYRDKFMAAQMLEASVANGVNLAIGESEIYGSRGPELIYLIPVMFYFAAEHYNNDQDNKQVFGTVDINSVKNFNFYASLFIDEISTADIFNTAQQRNQVGVTLGTRAYDLLFPNTDILIEYTRTNPWVYNHKYPDATYQSHQYDLGDWIGQNADDLYLEANYRPYRDLKVGLAFESLRKGAMDSTKYQYMLPTPPFLYGPVIKKQSFGVTAQYEIVRDMFINFHALLSRYSQQADVPGVFQYPRVSGNYDDRIDALVSIEYNFY